MLNSVLPHFGIGWRAFKAHPRVLIASMLILSSSWVVLEVAVISLHQLGIIVWLALHIAFLIVFSGLMVGFHRLALTIVNGTPPALSDLTGSLLRGPTLLLAGCIYLLAIACGLVLLVVPGIYVAVRYALFGQVIATKSTSALESLADAAALSKGRWWTMCIFFLLALLLNLAGAAFLGIGLILTFPISLLATSDLYRSLVQPARMTVGAIDPIER